MRKLLLLLTKKRSLDATMQIPPLFKGDFPFWEKAAAGDKVMHPHRSSMGAGQEFYLMQCVPGRSCVLFLKKSQEIAPPEIDRWWLLCFSRHRLSHCVYIERPLACKYTRNVRVHAALGARGVRRSNNAGGGLS